MHIEEIIDAIEQLAHGQDPDTGEQLPDSHELAQPTAIRALFAALERLREQARKPRNSGQPWRVEDEARLAAGYSADRPVAELAKQLGRSQKSIKVRLMHLGLMEQEEVGQLRY